MSSKLAMPQILPERGSVLPCDVRRASPSKLEKLAVDTLSPRR